jgi:hypothetical protein
MEVGNFDPQKAGNLELPETGLCSELRRYSAKMAISVTHEERANPGFYEEKPAGTLFFCLFKQIAELANRRCSPAFLAIVSAFAVAAAVALHAQTPAPHPSFEVLTHRMDVDVDGAPNTYASLRERILSNVAFPAQLGEVAIMLRLLIKGAKPQPLDAAASLPAAGWAASVAFDNSAVRPRVKPPSPGAPHEPPAGVKSRLVLNRPIHN